MLKSNRTVNEIRRCFLVVIKTQSAIEDGKKIYNEMLSENNVSFPPPRIITGSVEELLNSPAMDRLVQSLTKLYIESKGMK